MNFKKYFFILAIISGILLAISLGNIFFDLMNDVSVELEGHYGTIVLGFFFVFAIYLFKQSSTSDSDS